MSSAGHEKKELLGGMGRIWVCLTVFQVVMAMGARTVSGPDPWPTKRLVGSAQRGTLA